MTYCVDVVGLVQSMMAGQWLDEREYEVAGDLTIGDSLAPRKGRQMKASKVSASLSIAERKSCFF